MLRELQVQELKPVKAQFAAASAMVVGMGVVIDRATGTVKKPTAATAVNIYVVDKEREAKGKNNIKTNFSDRFVDFVNISEGEKVKIHTYDVGDVFATDQTANINTLAAASYAKVGTDGKWAVSSDPTKFKVVGVYNDAGNPMVEIEIVEVEPITELPAAGTNGNVLTASSGEWVSAAPASQLPAVTSEDAGDVLTVNESGEWENAAPSGGGYYIVTETLPTGGSLATLDKTAGEIFTAFATQTVLVVAEREEVDRGVTLTYREKKIVTNVTRTTSVDPENPLNDYDDFTIYAGGDISWTADSEDAYPERNFS